ncbi:MAG TPA: enoyl-CoA hydratase-related protein [Mycobacteriales bacterium]|nr:enoyl-CoA hydratase-related protein [Mycobacteriales bacterium]
MTETLFVDHSDGVATLTLNRPESLNSLSTELKEALLAALTDAAGDDAVRAVVLAGQGRAFCVGQDLREHVEGLHGDSTPLDTVRAHYNPIVLSIAGMPKPVVAAVGGMAAGAGASLAFAADFRIAGESSKFLLAFANIGLTADSGASWTLPRLVGHARATALLMLAEPLAAQHALDMGLVNAVVPDDRVLVAAHELAARLAAGPTLAYAAIKESLVQAWSCSLAEALEREAVAQLRLGATADHRDATDAFVAKRKPTFHAR